MRQPQWKWFLGLILFVALLMFAGNVHAAHKVLWPGGGSDSNSGNDWDNAYANMRKCLDNVARGDTIFTAGGWEVTTIRTDFDVAESGANFIYIVATLPHLGATMAGWDDSLDYKYTMISSSTSIAAVILFDTGYYRFDGIIGATPDSSKISEHDNKRLAFAWADSTNNSGSVIHLDGADHIYFNAVEVSPGGMFNWEAAGGGSNNTQSCITSTASFVNDDIKVQYCYLHDANDTHLNIYNVTNSIVEHNFFANRAGEPHGQSISWNPDVLVTGDVTSNSIIRYNFFKNIQGTGNITIQNGTHRNFEIYGNVFFTQDNTIYYNTNSYIGNTNTAGDNAYNMEVYNNTFYGLTPNIGGVQWNGAGTGNITKNNLFFDCGVVPLYGSTTLDNNSSERVGETVGADSDSCEHDLSGDPYMSVVDGSENFKPVAGYAGQDVGSDLSGTFTLDIAGATFGADGGWDVGAYEGTAGTPPVLGPPYFANSVTGDDSKGGGDAANALFSLGAVKDSVDVNGSAGDFVYLAGDSEFRETLIVGIPGSAGNPITYTRYGEGADPIINGSDKMTGSPGWVAPGGTTTTVNDVADDDCYRNSTYYEEYGTNTLLVAGDAFGDSSSFIIKVTIPADYSSGDSTTVRFPDAQRVGGATLPKLNFYIENKAATSITNAATYNLALGDSGSVHILVEYGLVNQTDTVFIDIQPLIDEAIADGIAAGEDVNICCKVIDIETNQYNQFDALEAGDKPAYVKWDYTATGGAANVYTLEGVSTETKIVFFDDAFGTKVASAPLVNSQDEWFWTTAGDDTLYIYTTTAADTLNIEAGQRDYGINNGTYNYIVYDKLHIKNANSYGFNSGAAGDNLTLQNMVIEYSASNGTKFLADNSTITSITINNNGWIGFEITGGNNNTLSSNTINDNLGNGIKIVGGDTNTISGNDIYDNGSHGVYLLTSCDDNVIKWNEIYGNSGVGINFNGTCDGNSAYYNIIRDNSQGVRSQNDSDDATFDNNVIFNNLIHFRIANNTCDNNIFRNNISLSPTGVDHYHILHTSGVSYTGTNNLFFPINTNDFSDDDGSTKYSTLAAWQAAVSTETNSLDLYPQVADTLTYDFTLLTDPLSPCIGAGTLIAGLIRDYAGLTVPAPAGQNPDIGAHEEQTVLTDLYNRILTKGVPGRMLDAGVIRKILTGGKP